MTRPWFDPQSGVLTLEEQVTQMPSFQQLVEGHAPTHAQLHEQAERTSRILKKLDSLLSPEAHALATEALCELALLHTMQMLSTAAPGHPHVAGGDVAPAGVDGTPPRV